MLPIEPHLSAAGLALGHRLREEAGGGLTRFHSGRLPASLGRGPFLLRGDKFPFAGDSSGGGTRAFRDLPGRGRAAAAGGSVGGWGADVAAPFPFPFHQIICDRISQKSVSFSI